MAPRYRVLFQTYDDNEPDKVVSEKTLLERAITIPTNCFDFGMAFNDQMGIIQSVQDCVLSGKTALINEKGSSCPDCDTTLKKFGKHTSTFNDVYTDHVVTIQRLKCPSCAYEPRSTMRTLLNTNQSGELQKIQSVLGAKFTFRDVEDILTLMSSKIRNINNHMRVKQVAEELGNKLKEINKDEQELLSITESKELIVAVDGGHVNTTEVGKRSMEAMTAVVYNEASIQANKKETRNYLSSKNCAASVKDDNQKEMIQATIIAALKQGLSPNTHIYALCDGAKNCWNIIEGLRPLSKGITCILDWFHITMKMENIALPEKLKSKFIRVKWHLWRGNVKAALIRLNELIEEDITDKYKNRILKFREYLSNNEDKIINYRQRKKNDLVFTSNLAESTVESLINQRCKQQQHMRWTRKGLDPILQLRATINSHLDWESRLKMAILAA